MEELLIQNNPIVAVNKHLVSILSLSRFEIENLFNKAEEIAAMPSEDVCQLLRRKILAVMFFQPSTRTRLSFETAMLKLGGKIIGFSDFKTTRSGDFFQEGLDDTVKVISQMADVIVMRHFLSRTPFEVAKTSPIPIINAGDGTNEHPTQALSDIWLLRKMVGNLRGLKVGLVGDINNRSLFSILAGLVKFSIKEVLLLLPPGKRMSERAQVLLKKYNVGYKICETMEEILINVESILMIPFVVPAFEKPYVEPTGEPFKLGNKYVLDKKLFLKVGRKIPILHTGPRGQELAVDMNEFEQFAFFKQVKESIFMRMAILYTLLEQC